MNILIYGAASHNRSPDQQGQAELLISLQHKVSLLTLGADDIVHRNFRALGASAFSSAHIKGKSVFFFLKQAIYFAKFCKEHKIDVAFCHMHGNALIAGMAKYFIRTKIVYVRHHTDEFKIMGSKKDAWINRFANILSARIVAISDKVKDELIKDGVNPKKIYRINLCYNFDQWLVSEIKGDAVAIRNRMNSSFVLLCVARMINSKRHLLAFEVVKILNQKGIDCTLLCVGTGVKQKELEQWISENKMNGKIVLEGFKTNIADYLEAADMLIHPSYSEASNQIVKEIGLLKKPAIVCSDVGDFDQYIKHNVNSYIVDKENPVPEMVALLERLIFQKKELAVTGEQLYFTILNTFSIDAVKEKYVEILKFKPIF